MSIVLFTFLGQWLHSFKVIENETKIVIICLQFVMKLGIREAKLVGGYLLWLVAKSFLVTVLLQPAS